MAHRLPRKLAIAGLLGLVGLTTACPPPWYFWRHERREERRDDRHERHDDHRGRHDDRHDDHKERHDDHKERHDDHKERGH